MGDQAAEAVDGEVDTVGHKRGRRRPWTLAIAVSVAVVVAVGTWVAIDQYRSRGIDLFGPSGGGYTAVRPPGQTLYFGAIGAADSSVIIDELRPNLVSNTAQATVQFTLCRLRDPRSSLGAGSASDVADICATSTPFRPGRYKLEPKPGRTQKRPVSFDLILVNVTPTRNGSIKIDGTNIRYSQGERRGDQLAGATIEVATDESLQDSP